MVCIYRKADRDCAKVLSHICSYRSYTYIGFMKTDYLNPDSGGTGGRGCRHPWRFFLLVSLEIPTGLPFRGPWPPPRSFLLVLFWGACQFKNSYRPTFRVPLPLPLLPQEFLDAPLPEQINDFKYVKYDYSYFIISDMGILLKYYYKHINTRTQPCSGISLTRINYFLYLSLTLALIGMWCERYRYPHTICWYNMWNGVRVFKDDGCMSLIKNVVYSCVEYSQPQLNIDMIGLGISRQELILGHNMPWYIWTAVSYILW